MVPEIVNIHDLSFQLFIRPDQIEQRVLALGQEIGFDYEEEPPLFLVVLNGAFIFAADLVRATPLAATIDFVKLSSYEGLSSSGNVKTILGPSPDKIKGKHIILVEDIVDTGNTLSRFKEDLLQLQPLSVKIASLLLKPDALEHELEVDYLGFSIPPEFVIGYGLDYDQGGRHLGGIYQKI